MHRATAILKVVGLCLVSLLVGMSTISAQDASSGKVTLESKSIALGVGVSWGDGVLEYKGKKYPFTVEGLSVVDLVAGRTPRTAPARPWAGASGWRYSRTRTASR